MAIYFERDENENKIQVGFNELNSKVFVEGKMHFNDPKELKLFIEELEIAMFDFWKKNVSNTKTNETSNRLMARNEIGLTAKKIDEISQIIGHREMINSLKQELPQDKDILEPSLELFNMYDNKEPLKEEFKKEPKQE